MQCSQQFSIHLGCSAIFGYFEREASDDDIRGIVLDVGQKLLPQSLVSQTGEEASKADVIEQLETFCFFEDCLNHLAFSASLDTRDVASEKNFGVNLEHMSQEIVVRRSQPRGRLSELRNYMLLLPVNPAE